MRRIDVMGENAEDSRDFCTAAKRRTVAKNILAFTLKRTIRTIYTKRATDAP